jgi:hypothetical protein
MLYPDRQLPGFLERNRIPADQLKAIPLLQKMIDRGDRQIVVRDADGCYRFSANFTNAGDLKTRLTKASEVYGDEITTARSAILSLYEAVFNHKEFTGRSGTMFGFEGLGSIYWHMVSKLLLAVMENFFAAIEQGADDQVVQRLGQLYYLVREGIGFNKTPIEYGAFPTDPYSHTPKHAGARQPGMTGQVKEEVLSRFGELGIRISDGLVTFQPSLLRAREFVEAPRTTGFVDVNNNWQTVSIPLSGLAFTWCQVPIIYTLNKQNKSGITLRLNDGEERHLSQLSLPAEESRELFQRTGRIQKIHVDIDKKQLFDELYSG